LAIESASLLAFTAYAWLLHNAPISTVATYAFVNPVVAVLLGWWLLSEELTAATLQRAIQAVRAGTLPESSFGGFAYRVAASAIVDRVRRAGRVIPSGLRASDLDEGNDREVAEAIGAEGAARAFAAAVDRNVLRRSFEVIADAHFRVILLRYFDGLDIGEASAALGCSHKSFSVRLNRALRALSSALDEEAKGAA